MQKTFIKQKNNGKQTNKQNPKKPDNKNQIDCSTWK